MRENERTNAVRRSVPRSPRCGDQVGTARANIAANPPDHRLHQTCGKLCSREARQVKRSARCLARQGRKSVSIALSSHAVPLMRRRESAARCDNAIEQSHVAEDLSRQPKAKRSARKCSGARVRKRFLE